MIVRHLMLAALVSLTFAANASAVPAGMNIIATIDVPDAKTVSKTVTLPSGSHSVYIGAHGHIFCEHIRLQYPDGSKSTALLDSDMPDKKGMTQGAQNGKNYVAAEVSCHGSPSGQLVLAVAGQ
jgi:hypothetical protein